jgi:hypothetical protein
VLREFMVLDVCGSASSTHVNTIVSDIIRPAITTLDTSCINHSVRYIEQFCEYKTFSSFFCMVLDLCNTRYSDTFDSV